MSVQPDRDELKNCPCCFGTGKINIDNSINRCPLCNGFGKADRKAINRWEVAKALNRKEN